MTETPASQPSPEYPLVSVVIATHNYAHFLPEAVRSVQAQTYSHWECIIVDDASTDNTPEIAAEFVRSDSRIHYLRNAQNKGEAGSRNVGNAEARGEYIAVLDADDWWMPDKLQRLIEALQKVKNGVLCFCAVTTFDGKSQTEFAPDADWLNTLGNSLRMDCAINHSSVLISRQAVEAVGGYDERLPFGVDWDLWLKLLSDFGEKAFVYVPESLVAYRWHASNMSHSIARNRRGERTVICRTLMRSGWGMQHPFLAFQVVACQLERELTRYERAGAKRQAILWAVMRACLSPLRRWRWQRVIEISHS